MKPHKIISAFKHGGRLISPPGEWTPSSQERADKLIAAKCLRPPKESQRQSQDAGRSVPTIEEVRAAGYSEIAAHGVVAQEAALAAGKSEAEADELAHQARAAAADRSLGASENPPPPGDGETTEQPKPQAKAKAKGSKRGRK